MAFQIFRPEQADRCPIRGVLFDMDGLVLDSEKLYARFWAEGTRFYGYDMSYTQALGMRALSAQAGKAKIAAYFGPEADYQLMRAKRMELMESFIEENGVECKPGIHELLTWLHEQGIRTAITSSSPMDRIRRHLALHGLDTRFDALCSGHDVPNGKPAPDIYLHGAASLGLKPEECLALEDAPAGIESAFRAGCLAVVVPDLDQPGEETLARCFARADSLSDIIGLLEQLNACLL